MANQSYSLEAEIAVLGGLINDPEKMYEVSELIYSDCFYDKRHQIIYQAYLDLFNKKTAIDLLTVIDLLRDENTIKLAGGVEYVTEISEKVSIATNIVDYARIIYEKFIIRQTIARAEIIAQGARTAPDANAALDIAQSEVLALSQLQRSSEFLDWQQILDDSQKHLEDIINNGKSLTGLSTGFGKLDKYTNGLSGGELIILAARPSVGKTAFALNLMRNVAKSSQNNNPRIAFFSLEMPATQIINRFLAIQSGISISKISSGDLSTPEQAVIEKTYKILQKYMFSIDETAALPINELKTKVRKLKLEHGLDAIFIDYLQLITTNQPQIGRTQEVSLISRELKAIAKELNVPVVALSQLSRKVEDRQGKKPQMSDIRESGAIEQDADIIMMLYRPEYYKNSGEEVQVAYTGQTILQIEKNRNGATGEIEFIFTNENNSFNEADYQH